MKGACRKTQSQMIDACYGQLDRSRQTAFDEHIASCRLCRNTFADMQTTLGTMSRRTAGPEDEGYWNGYWARLVPRIEHAQARPPVRTAFGVRLRTVFAGVAAVALLVAGVTIDRFLLRDTTTPPPASHDATDAGIMRTVAAPEPSKRALEYIDRSKTLLLGIVNIDPDRKVIDLSKQRQISRELLHQAHAVRKDLDDPRQTRLRHLVDDLQVILLEIANMEVHDDLPAVNLIRSGVDRKAILLKINLEQMEVAAEAERTATERDSTNARNL